MAGRRSPCIGWCWSCCRDYRFPPCLHFYGSAFAACRWNRLCGMAQAGCRPTRRSRDPERSSAKRFRRLAGVARVPRRASRIRGRRADAMLVLPAARRWRVPATVPARPISDLCVEDRGPHGHALLFAFGHAGPCALSHHGKTHSTSSRQAGWTPATFAHDKLFLLDSDHNATCVTCHAGNDYKRYTCYGCHEHQPDKIRRKHEKEGIRDFENCVKCHRSAEEKEGREGGHGNRARD